MSVLIGIKVAVFRSVTARQLSVALVKAGGYMASPPGGLRVMLRGLQAGAVVVPAGAGLVAPAPG